MKQHRRSSSLVHFSAELPRPLRQTRTSPPSRARRRVGSEPSGRAGEVFDECPLRPGDGGLLLNMVHDLQQNMTQSISGSERGRLYGMYTQRRDGKLREQLGSPEWARKKEAMRTMEDLLEETLALMKARSGDPAAGKNSLLQHPRCSFILPGLQRIH